MIRISEFCKRLGLRRPSFGGVAAVLSLLGLAGLIFVAGAAVMYFGYSPADFLRKAFAGAEAWLATTDSTPPQGDLTHAQVTVDKSEATWDGYTLYTTTQAAEASLMDMHGKVVHQWKMTDARPWPKALQVRDPKPGEPLHWERCHLFPNGDLLALCCFGNGTPYGYGLAKFDRASKLLWAYSANVHHAIDVGEDGRIYVLIDKFGAKAPAGVDNMPQTYTADLLAVLSPEGKELDIIPILEAFQNSPFFLTLFSSNEIGPKEPFGPPGVPPGVNGPLPPGLPPSGVQFPPGGLPPGGLPPSAPPHSPGHPAPTDPLDFLHTNSVKVLSQGLAPKFSLFKPGQVLLSLRTPSVLAVLDIPTRSIVWAARGVWKFQHDANFLSNGKLLLFDNFGSSHGSRVLEYDPATQAIPWSYGCTKATSFVSTFRGANQRLANGNTLIVDSEGLRVLEVTESNEVVWKWQCPLPPKKDQNDSSFSLNFTCARRYGPTELTFLKGDNNARPN